ncbi:psbP domain-containing protein 7, chloroplastic [Telopea speciosissima]|uniref:psbP domain-containing protein 7, chloroplastic n=1 Tax=Telopea speciosissima TaxID=54955 RepID=UPI001CC5D647|nr:psbP domain-containing protein 7, chloroplastic [Telopea speciosissima]
MALHLQPCFTITSKSKTHRLHRIYQTQYSGDRKESSSQEETPRLGKSPAEDFAPLASVFRWRLLTGVGSASLVALGANFTGITSFLLGLSPETGRNLKLDIVYPIGGYNRSLDTSQGFEFIYPVNWVGDQTLLYRAIGKAESERSLDPPPLINNQAISPSRRRRQDFSDPVVAFGPPGSNGELNVSVIVSRVPLDFSIEAFGGPKEVGEAVMRTIAGGGSSGRGVADVKATLMELTVREDPTKKVNYYKLDFRVEGSSFRRHNVAICCARGGRLFSLNAQAPESAWTDIKPVFYTIADSFIITS